MEVLKLINRRLMTKVTSVHKDIKYVIFQNLKNEKCLVKYHMHLLKYMIKDILLYYYNYAFHQLPWQYVKIKLINPTYVPVTTQCFYFCRGFIFMIIMQKECLLVFSWQNKVKKSERNDWKVNYISLRYYMHCLPYVKFVNKWPSLPVLHVSLRGALRRHTDRLWPLYISWWCIASGFCLGRSFDRHYAHSKGNDCNWFYFNFFPCKTSKLKEFF